MPLDNMERPTTQFRGGLASYGMMTPEAAREQFLMNQEAAAAEEQSRRARLADLEASPAGQALRAQEAEAKQYQDLFKKNPKLQEQFLMEKAKNQARGGSQGIMTAEGYITKEQALAKNAKPASMLGHTEIDDESARNLAIESLYDSNATAGFRRSPQMMSKIMKKRTEVMNEAGVTPQDVISGRAGFKADTTSLNKITPQYDAITAFENTAIRNGKILNQIASKVDTTGVPVIERWVRAGKQAIAGDPDVAQFNAQLNLYRAEAARILTQPNLSGVLTDTARKEMEEFLKPGASAQQILQVTNLLERDFHNRKQTLEDQIGAIRSRMSKRVSPNEAQNPIAPNAPAQAAPLTPQEAAELQQLRKRFGR